MKNNRRLRIRFILFNSEVAPTNPRCNMLQTSPGRKIYQEQMSGERPSQSLAFVEQGQCFTERWHYNFFGKLYVHV